MQLTLICKGGTNIGLGHLQRSISFVLSSDSASEIVVLAIIDKGLEGLFKPIGNTIFFYSDEELESYLSKIPPSDLCVLDMIEISAEAQSIIRNKFRKVISLSPIFCNYNIIDYLFTRFKDFSYPDNVTVFGGLEYAIFNQSCTQISDTKYDENVSQKELSVGISMGGTDAPNKTLKILQAVSKLKFHCTFWVLLGEGYSYSYQELVDTIKRDSLHEIILAKSNSSMWKILSNCSLAILAGGLTSIEAIYAGLPCINIFEKEIHQAMISKELIDRNVNINLGLLNDLNMSRLCDLISKFNDNRTELLQMRSNTKSLIDKEGAFRTYKKIIELSPI
jgi:spore coat polysaccharide biosynthesis predicted glycosyltransferase SpsG